MLDARQKAAIEAELGDATSGIDAGRVAVKLGLTRESVKDFVQEKLRAKQERANAKAGLPILEV